MPVAAAAAAATAGATRQGRIGCFGNKRNGPCRMVIRWGSAGLDGRAESVRRGGRVGYAAPLSDAWHPLPRDRVCWLARSGGVSDRGGRRRHGGRRVLYLVCDHAPQPRVPSTNRPASRPSAVPSSPTPATMAVTGRSPEATAAWFWAWCCDRAARRQEGRSLGRPADEQPVCSRLWEHKESP